MLTVIFGILAAVCALGWWTCDTNVKAIIHFMDLKGYTPPTSEEVRECVRWAVKRKLSKKS